ncbi:NAD(P)H-dependent oxidoreductase [Amycolatopsis sp. K13G38]|uniref:NAD(P)H-dependent oxidoreductase n=1 Tax=Amycolatopsis acididurans TaxID=2724524 RepID=A0ABX1J7S6_9PSEU|nr:NAD(P)H-dependent oxidoreductase [Amycolatopsis acididurans]NKQ55361.1 NAD(P)H-dependent oxidoreductase [Amycolatopsis acididurans]
MKVLWLFAHPEPASLNAALRDEGLRALRELGHEYVQSDLYEMKWDPIVREIASFDPDVVAEQEKISWADTLVVQFPLWWYGMPAILKGWFDRVFVKGFGYGLKDENGRVLRYGEGMLAGKRAMIVTTAGGRASSLGPRGVNGNLEQLLFPLQHGTFWYTGMAALPPFVVYSADRTDAAEFTAAASGLRERLARLETTEPIPYRAQNGGDYDSDLVLLPHLAAGRTDLDVHQR